MHPSAEPEHTRALATTASSGAPMATHLPPWMRASPGYAPMPLATAPFTFSASPARYRRGFGRRRTTPAIADVAGSLVLIPTSWTSPSH